MMVLPASGPIWVSPPGATRRTWTAYMQHHIGMHDEVHNIYGLTWDKVVKEQFENVTPTGGSSR